MFFILKLLNFDTILLFVGDHPGYGVFPSCGWWMTILGTVVIVPWMVGVHCSSLGCRWLTERWVNTLGIVGEHPRNGGWTSYGFRAPTCGFVFQFGIIGDYHGDEHPRKGGLWFMTIHGRVTILELMGDCTKVSVLREWPSLGLWFTILGVFGDHPGDVR